MARPRSRDSMAGPPQFVGAQLQKLREAAGYDTQGKLATAMGCDPSVVWHAEQGRRVPSVNRLTLWLDLCNLTGPGDLPLRELLEELAVLARSGDGPVPSWFESWLEVEVQAHSIRIWQPLIIPGPLQTWDYARALFAAQQVHDDRLDDMASARTARQSIFDRAEPPHVVAVLDELVLHRMIGSPRVMAEALEHLAELASRPNFSIHVLPSREDGANAGLSSGFFLASVEGRPDVAILETVVDQTTDNRMLTRNAAIVLDHVRGDAQPVAASRVLIQEAAEKWKTQ